MDGGFLAGYSPRGRKESDTTKQLYFLTRNDLKLLIEIIANSFFNVEVGVIKQQDFVNKNECTIAVIESHRLYAVGKHGSYKTLKYKSRNKKLIDI